MDNHKKPTTEELEAQIAATQAELDKQIAEETTPHVPSESNPTPSEAIPSEPVPSEPIPSESEPTPSEPIPDEDLETKYKESSKEARRLVEEEKKINDAFHEANNLASPTEEQLLKEYPAWDEMSDTEKKLATDNLINKQRFDVLQKSAEDRRVVEVWNEKVETHIDNPKTLIAFPGLEGKQEEFVAYATDKSRRNINMDVLVKSFLFEQLKNKVQHKGKMFETGSGGEKEKEKQKSDKLTVDEGQQLMTSNYKLWKEYLKAGKIANE